jgi:type IV secretion system protein TrbJ
MKNRIAVTLLLVMLLGGPLYAVLGIGDVVFDPTSYANAVLMMGELVKSYEQLRSAFNLQTFLATTVPVNMVARYQTPTTTWQNLQVPSDAFGNLGPWTQQVNQGGQAQVAYNSASVGLRTYGSGLAQLSPDERVKVASQYASVELTDGTNINSMETIGQLRANARTTDQALAGLESDSLSSDPAMNSEIAVLNKINAATVAHIRAARDTNLLLLGTLEQQLAESKRRRDADVTEINTQIVRLEQGAAAKAQYTSTVTQSLRSFRWR